MKKASVSFLFLTLVPLASWAGWAFDLSGSITMGHFSSASLSDNSIYMYEFTGGYADKALGIGFGVVYTGLAGNVWSSTGTSTYTGSLMGAKLFYSPPKWRWMGLGMSYYPGASLSEQNPTSTTEHLGSAMEFETGFHIQLSASWQTSLKLSYYSLNMTNNTTGGVASTTTYTRTLVFPTASIRYGF